MPNYNSIKELTRGLHQGAKLLNDMFLKRKTLAVKWDDAVETLDGDDNRLKHLIDYGVVVETDGTLELEETYRKFFEEVLAVNEDINVAAVQTYISKLRLNINAFLVADTPGRRAQYLREIRHTFKTIASTTHRNVVDLKRNVDLSYKQEPNFKIKELRLRHFDEKRKLIAQLITQTEKTMDSQTIFFANAAHDMGLKQTVSEVKEALHQAAHALIDLSHQIIDYLNKIEYQSRLVKKIKQLKYMKDQLMMEESTDVINLLAAKNDLWMEKLPKYITRVNLDFLRNDDAALVILQNIRSRLFKKTTIKARLAGKIDEKYLSENSQTSRMFNHAEIMSGFMAQSIDLFSYVWNYQFSMPVDAEMRLVLFLQLASGYEAQLTVSDETKQTNEVEYPLIYSK